MAVSYTLSEKAVLKILLHAARYPSSQICGLLISNKDSQQTEIVDCIPLFHTSLGFSSSMEIALLTISAWCAQQQYQIAGYYEADDSLKSPNELSTTGKRVGEKIIENSGHACVGILDNSKLEGVALGGSDLFPLIQFQKESGGGWSKKGSIEHQVVKLSQLFMQLLADHKHLLVVDFDEFLDNVDSDWMNEGLLDYDVKEQSRKQK
eukprot:TRINITY_DN5246_c0_g1_i2.p1 TRINITY_DN5246_c0_g1~~TRINITY_DN5246_c0_g1_i2.p1  ORF type:complete len:207 (-),score=29.94 TRINITY_DN5246_c0_g1_i2:140-760(-)